MDRHGLPAAEEGWPTGLRQTSLSGSASVHGSDWSHTLLPVGAAGMADRNGQTQSFVDDRNVDLQGTTAGEQLHHIPGPAFY